MTAPTPPRTLSTAETAAQEAALASARAAQQAFVARYLCDLPAGLAPAFRFDPHG
jgi:hypothetical protein